MLGRSFSFDADPLVCLIFVAGASGVISRKSVPKPKSGSFVPMFSSRSFMVWDLTFKSLIQFKLIV